jgi:hypothetical protein
MAMPRLRIRIELNRGGVGVPLHKLASVVEESQKFFYLLTEDVHIDQSQGEWLGFDFGNESLNFTAEFVGPVNAEQVAAFHAAFDGTTSLRRATISQFARITDAIEQDELIGFGLYSSDEGNDPTEWRCLSRRDALRITEEIQLLIAASGEEERESRLPAVTTTGAGARMFSDRRERGLESAKWAAYVREVEANVDRRITRVEQALESQSDLIEDLHVKSSSTEDSVRKLLTAVEGFCAQTTRQLEAISAPAVAASAAAASDAAAPVAAPPVVEATPEAPAKPVIVHAPMAEKIQEPESALLKPQQPPVQTQMKPQAEPTVQPQIQPQIQPWTAPPQTVRRVPSSPLTTMESGWAQKLDWRLAGGAALLVAGAVIIVVWAWQNLFSGPSVQRVAATSSAATSTTTPVTQFEPPPPLTQPESPAPLLQTPQPETAAKSVALAPASTGQHVTLQASEITWVSTRDAAGKQMLARVFEQGNSQTLDLPNGATVRVGNAGGLNILLNGASIGPLGKHGEVREVVFKNGSYKIAVAN